MPEPIDESIHGRNLRAVFANMHDELRRHAVALAGQGQWPTGGPTDLMSEAMLRLLDSKTAKDHSLEELQAMIPSIMRSVLVDRARRRGALKREAFGRASSEEVLLREVAARSSEVGTLELEDLDEALQELAKSRPKSAQIIEARIFSGLSAEDAAKLIGVGNVSAKMHWVEGLRFLRRRFGVLDD